MLVLRVVWLGPKNPVMIVDWKSFECLRLPISVSCSFQILSVGIQMFFHLENGLGPAVVRGNYRTTETRLFLYNCSRLCLYSRYVSSWWSSGAVMSSLSRSTTRYNYAHLDTARSAYLLLRAKTGLYYLTKRLSLLPHITYLVISRIHAFIITFCLE